MLQKYIEERNSFADGKGYIPFSEFCRFQLGYASEIRAIRNALKSSRILGEDVAEVLNGYVYAYDYGTKFLKKHNDAYINHYMAEHPELAELLKDLNPQIRLSPEQITAVLTEEDNLLIHAGAGTGKTTVLLAILKHLVKNRGVDPQKVLMLSYTRATVEELRTKVHKLGINCDIKTFHSVGKWIVEYPDQNPNPENAVILENKEKKDNLAVKISRFTKSLYKHEQDYDELIDLFMWRLVCPDAQKHEELSTTYTGGALYLSMRSKENGESEYYPTAALMTAANWLYLHGFDYIFFPKYDKQILYSNRIYIPTFYYSKGETQGYLDVVCGETAQMGRLHEMNDPCSLKSYVIQAGLNDCEAIESQLNSIFQTTSHSDICRETIKNYLSSKDGKNTYLDRIANILYQTVSAMKYEGIDSQKASLVSKMIRGNADTRCAILWKYAQKCYVEYENLMRRKDVMDFEDVLAAACGILESGDPMIKKYDYIFVDEYQDVSLHKSRFVQLMKARSSAHVIAVGDERQSIYAFAGARMTEFGNFEDLMGYTAHCSLTVTRRFSQELCELADNFVKNAASDESPLVSEKHHEHPVTIISYPKDLTETACNVLDEILKKYKGKRYPKIAFLARHKKKFEELHNSSVFRYDEDNHTLVCKSYPGLVIHASTIHAAKGLEYEYVVLLSGESGAYGFPDTIPEEPLLKYLRRDEEETGKEDEERRLMYVGMTRTQEELYILSNEKRPSSFVMELWDSESSHIMRIGNRPDPQAHTCPSCGYPLYWTHDDTTNLDVRKCSNYPSCGEMYGCGEVHGKDYKLLPVRKCPQCRDGFLLGRQRNEEMPFYGCSRYSGDGTGCSCTEGKNFSSSMDDYEGLGKCAENRFYEFCSNSNYKRRYYG